MKINMEMEEIPDLSNISKIISLEIRNRSSKKEKTGILSLCYVPLKRSKCISIVKIYSKNGNMF